MGDAIPKFMTCRQFAKFSGLPYTIVLELIKTGKLQGFRSGHKTYYILVESYRDIATPTFEAQVEVSPEERAKSYNRISKLKQEG